jgi:hypothetical protein
MHRVNNRPIKGENWPNLVILVIKYKMRYYDPPEKTTKTRDDADRCFKSFFSLPSSSSQPGRPDVFVKKNRPKCGPTCFAKSKAKLLLPRGKVAKNAISFRIHLKNCP